MTINNQSKAVMNAAKSLPELPASQGARRATGEAGNSAALASPSHAGTEVVPRARRRHFTNADKRRILQAADRCTQPGEIGAAAGLLYPFFGILLSPVVAAAAMALSSVSVIANSLRLRTSKLEV